MKQNRKGLLLVISGPAGVGKGTINLSLISRNSDIRMFGFANRIDHTSHHGDIKRCGNVFGAFFHFGNSFDQVGFKSPACWTRDDV